MEKMNKIEGKTHYLIRSQSLWTRSPRLQEQFPNPNSSDYNDFIDTEAIIYQRELQEHGVPFPEWEEMLNVGGETDLRIFLKIGLECYKAIRNQLPEKLDNIRILDFGVGCGRTVRHFYRESANLELYGSDVDKKSIDWIDKNVKFIKACINQNKPPLPYSCNYFDFMYSISLFTHFDRNSFNEWMDEMERCLKSGGKAILTFHGSTAFNLVQNASSMNQLNIDIGELTKNKKNYYEDGFVWAKQKVQSSDIDSNSFGICFIDENQITKLLPKGLKIEKYIPGHLGGWQDIAVLTKK